MGILQRLKNLLASRKTNTSDAIVECGAALATATDYEAALILTVRAAVAHSGASAGYLMLADGSGSLIAECAYSPEGDFEFPQKLALGQGTSGYVAKSGQPMRVCKSKRGGDASEHFEIDAQAIASVPIRLNGERGPQGYDVVGVLTVIHRRNPKAFDQTKLNRLSAFASIVAMAAANRRLQNFQKQTLTATLERLSNALEAKDSFTDGHSLRVSAISLEIAEDLGVSGEALEDLRLGTILHDIGKVAIPDAILNKKGKLTDEEFAQLRMYPAIGYEICQNLSLPQGVLLLVRNHHEKLDGTGYPDGLKGGEITLPLRIIAVADAFDAMISARAYRRGMAADEVLLELSRFAGTAYDPVVVQTLRDLVQCGRFDLVYRQTLGGPSDAEKRAS